MKRCCIAIGLVCIAAISGCARSSPVTVVQSLVEAAREGDRAAVMQLLGPKTRARLVADAQTASEQAGRRHLGPEDLLAAGWTPPKWEQRTLRVASRTGSTAVVEVEGRGGERGQIECVIESGSWKVELP